MHACEAAGRAGTSHKARSQAPTSDREHHFGGAKRARRCRGRQNAAQVVDHESTIRISLPKPDTTYVYSDTSYSCSNASGEVPLLPPPPTSGSQPEWSPDRWPCISVWTDGASFRDARGTSSTASVKLSENQAISLRRACSSSLPRVSVKPCVQRLPTLRIWSANLKHDNQVLYIIQSPCVSHRWW
jgi:hypothetical protein